MTKQQDTRDHIDPEARRRMDVESQHIDAVTELRAIGDLIVNVDDPSSVRSDTWTAMGGRIVTAAREADHAFHDFEKPCADSGKPAATDLSQRLERMGHALFIRADASPEFIVTLSDGHDVNLSGIDELRDLVERLEAEKCGAAVRSAVAEIEAEGKSNHHSVARGEDVESEAVDRLEHFGISLFSRQEAACAEYAIIDCGKLLHYIGPTRVEESAERHDGRPDVFTHQALLEAVTEIEAEKTAAAGTFVPPAEARPVDTVRAFRGQGEADRFEAALARAADLGFCVLITSEVRDGEGKSYSIASGGELFLTFVPLDEVEDWIRSREQQGAA